MLAVLASSMLRLVSGTASLLSTVVASCLLLNITVSDQYLAIVVPGRMFRDSFDKFGLHAKNLSRALEDSGTVTSVLVPWNSCGAYNAGVLGVSTLTYLPFCFFNLASPLMSILLAVTGFTIEKKSVE
jgi:NhaC family Na+:H+ antiporter